nr:hypothetical protein [uncultured Carboxylicivirga sp.]
MDKHTIMIGWIVLYLMLIIFLDIKYKLLRDSSQALKKPYSLSRVQLALWSGVILSAYVGITFGGSMASPDLQEGILVILGISTGTTAVATLTDVSDKEDKAKHRHQDEEGTNLLIDIISDKDGPSIHRLQTVLFNVVIAVWLFIKVWKSNTIPDIEPTTLVLLGISSATYAGLKVTENKASSSNNKTTNEEETEVPPLG